MYTRRWTKMHWWHSLRHYRMNEMLPATRMSEILLTLGPQETDAPNLKIKPDPSMKEFMRLVNKLLTKYPELCQIPVNSLSGIPEMVPEKSHILVNFVSQQRELMRKGFSEEKAFETVEKQYHDRMVRKKNDFRLTLGAAINNQARSLMNFYQQQSEFEARLKVLRLDRDLQKFEAEQQRFKQEVMEKSSEIVPEDEALFSELRKESVPIQKPYTKVLEKVVSRFEKPPDPTTTVISRENAAENVKNFLEGSKNVYAMFLDLYCVKDRLKGLKDTEILAMLKETPTKIKTRSKKLRKKLEKFGVKLDKFGELDFSACGDQLPDNIRKSFLANKTAVRVALLSESLDFEFEHLEKRRERARELKSQLEKVENAERDSQKVDDSLVFEDRKSESYEPPDEKQQYTRAIGEWEKILRRNDQFFLQGASYRLIETQEEKLFRLEKKYLANKIQELENPQSNEQATPFIERLASTVDDFRRLKFMIEQESALGAGKALFEMQDSLLKFTHETAALYYEELEAFLNRKIDEKFSSQRELIDKGRIMKMIQPREWDERSMKPYSYAEEFKRMLTQQDSKEVAEEGQRKLLNELRMMEEEKQLLIDMEQKEEEEPSELNEEALKEDEEENLQTKEDVKTDRWLKRMELMESREGVGLKEKVLKEWEEEEELEDKDVEAEEKADDSRDKKVETAMSSIDAFDPTQEKERLLNFINSEKVNVGKAQKERKTQKKGKKK